MKIKVNVPDESIESLLVSIFETTASTYWCEVVRIEHSKLSKKFKEPAIIILNGGYAIIKDIEADDEKSYRLDLGSITKGLEAMAEEYGVAFGDILSDNADMETADVLLQCSLFGKTLYG